METREYKVYKFDELTGEQQQKALKRYYDINVDHDWWEDDGLLDVEQSKWVKYGLKDCLFRWKEIYFDIDRNHHLEFVDVEVSDEEVFRKALKVSKAAWNKTAYYFKTSDHRYANTRLEFEDAELYCGKAFTKKQQKEIDRAIEIFNDWREQALINLRKNYEYLTSEEAIIECLKANDYDFTEDGEID